MNKIKRWEVDFHGDEFIEDPNGEWVLWEDVEKLLAEMREELTPLPPTEGQAKLSAQQRRDK